MFQRIHECYIDYISRAWHQQSQFDLKTHGNELEIEVFNQRKLSVMLCANSPDMYPRSFAYGGQTYGHFNPPYHLSRQNSPHHQRYQSAYIYNAQPYGLNAFARSNPPPFNHISSPTPSAIHYPFDTRLAAPRQDYDSHCQYYKPPSLTPPPILSPSDQQIQAEKPPDHVVMAHTPARVAVETLAETCYRGMSKLLVISSLLKYSVFLRVTSSGKIKNLRGVIILLFELDSLSDWRLRSLYYS